MDIAINVIHKLFLTKIPNKQQNILIHPFSYIAVHVTMMFKGPMREVITYRVPWWSQIFLMTVTSLSADVSFLSPPRSTYHVMIILIWQNTLDFNH